MDNLILLDRKIVESLNGILGKKKWVDFLILFFAVYAPFLVCAGVAVWLYFADKNSLWKNIFWLSGLMLFTRFILVEFIRLFIKRKRPFLEKPDLKKVFHKSMELSFPSGHAAAFLALGVALLLFSKPLGALVFVVSIIIDCARVVAGVHYPSDIIGGILLGLVSGFAFRVLFQGQIFL